MIAPIQAHNDFYKTTPHHTYCSGSDLSVSSGASTLRALQRAKRQCAKLWLQQ
jgi:hypothetical protein